jgi:hypothetical protein
MLSYRIVDSKYYTGPLNIDRGKRITCFVLYDETGDKWWSYVHPMSKDVFVYR